ncbi:head decoration protein [Parendozoicomonas sp. Alg238-R29]|uniref:head decoration protein n=1 Tax=Parendozoicomonas sp. Alg238-R29 TaxID=2993446 RepID=UPI00248EEDC0|nr:head decoration protein [Parendozoicomonas sp. Alg238-R29]
MAIQTDKVRAGEFLLSEGNGSISRETVMVAAALMAGTVLGQVTADGTYNKLDLDASDGTENAAAILYAVSEADQKQVAVVRLAEVQDSKLTWPDGMTDLQKDAALAELAEKYVIVR